jgi:hypothetical protein
MGDPARGLYLGRVVRCGLGGASLGAGVIHGSAAFDHAEHPAQLVFFIAVAALQVAWAVIVLRRASWPLLKAGAAFNAGVIMVWIVSRTVGLPGVPGAEAPEPFGLKDGVASGLEFLLVAGVGSLIPAAGRHLRLASGTVASWVIIAGIGAVTVAGLAAPGHDDDEAVHSHRNGRFATSGDHHDDGTGQAGPAGHAHGPGEPAALGHQPAEPGHTHAGMDLGAADHHSHGPSSPVSHTGSADTGEGGYHAVSHGGRGHVYIPGHLHPEPGPHDRHDQHEAAQDHPGGGAGAAPHDPHEGAEHDHGSGAAPDPGHDHSGGGGHEDHCSAEGENPVLTQVREALQALGLGCVRR